MAPQLSQPVVPAPQQSAMQHQGGQGPQVDTILQGRIQAAQQAAQLQRPCVDDLITKLTSPMPRTSASLSHDAATECSKYGVQGAECTDGRCSGARAQHQPSHHS